MPGSTVPPQELVGPMFQWENSLDLVREVLTGDGVRNLWWEIPISATTPALSCWGCSKACELNPFSSSGKVKREEDWLLQKMSTFFRGEWEKSKKEGHF